MASPEIDPLITVTLVQVSWQDALEVVSEVAGCRVEERPGGALLLTQPPRVTLQFTDANVRTVLQMLAAYSKRNIVISPDVRGSVTLDLKDARWDEALLGITNTVGDFMVLLKGDDILQIVARSSTDSLVVTSYGEPWTPEKYNRFVAEQALQVNRWRPAADSRIPERPVEGDETAQRVSWSSRMPTCTRSFRRSPSRQRCP